jgi:hypothetical protein
MIFASVEVSTVQFEAAMQRLKAGVREGFVDPQIGLLPTQARLLAERCQVFTPPRNVGQGKAAVSRDISNIFRPLSHTTFRDPSIRKIIRTDDRPAWDKVALNFRGSHNLQNTKAIGFSPAWHTSNRNKRGRAYRAKYGNIGVVTLGPEGREARGYLKDKQKMVGWARAGWNAGIIGFGGAVKTAWVSRHGLGQGSFVNGTTSADPFVQVINSTSWAKRSKEGERIIRNAVAARARDMESYYFRMMKLAAAKAQLAA